MEDDRLDAAGSGMRRRDLAIAAAAAFATAWPRAQTAARALRILCASPPGGTPDVIARHFAARWPAGSVVDNRPGGAGFIAVAALMQSVPDGTTVLLGHAGLVTLNPFLYTRLPYGASDLVAVSTAAETAFAVVVGAQVPEAVRSLAAFVEWGRAHPPLAQFGTPLSGTMPHLLGLLLARDTGFAMSHVPYPGGPPVIADLLGGRLAAAVLPEGLVRPLHDAGKLRVLATSGAERTVLPSVPTLRELGYARLVLVEWFGFFVPRGTPGSAIDDAAQSVRSAVDAPALIAAMREAGLTALGSTPMQMQMRIERERAFWRDNAPATGVRIE